jgi:hypothetical protein
MVFHPYLVPQFLKECEYHSYAEGMRSTSKAGQSTMCIAKPIRLAVGGQTYDLPSRMH